MATRPQADDLIDVPRVDWTGFLRRFRWTPGEHVVEIGPTNRGKSTLAGLLLKRRKFAVALDFKGDDPGLLRWGWEAVEEWPIPGEAERLKGRVVERADGSSVRVVDPIRVRLAPPVADPDDIAAARVVFRDCLEDIFTQGRWAIYVDELLIATDRDLYDLAKPIHHLMVYGRSKGVSMVTATQAPRTIPKSTYQQVTHQFHWPIRDEEAFIRQAEITGLGRRNLRSVFRGMRKHEFLYVRPPDVFMISQAPPPVEPPASSSAPVSVVGATVDRAPRRASRARRVAWGRGDNR